MEQSEQHQEPAEQQDQSNSDPSPEYPKTHTVGGTPREDINVGTPAQSTSDQSPDQAQDAEPVEDQSAHEPYQPTRLPLENAGLDQHAAEEQRQAELAEQREIHNERTGGGEYE